MKTMNLDRHQFLSVAQDSLMALDNNNLKLLSTIPLPHSTLVIDTLMQATDS